MTQAPSWRPSAAYLYILRLDAVALAWEYLRRNLDYRQTWGTCGYRMPEHTARDWGLKNAEDPSLDARSAHPRWIPSPPTLARLTHDDESGDVNLPFSLWRITGPKAAYHDGTRVFLNAQICHQPLRISIGSDVQDGDPFALLVSPGPAAEACTPVIRHLSELLSARKPPSKRHAPIARPTRQSMGHMRVLQALDGAAAGASQREIADVLFGEIDTWRRWNTNSELRAQVRYLLRRGREWVNGGYRNLLTRSHPCRDGETHSPADSP
jgi:hypothetical protein